MYASVSLSAHEQALKDKVILDLNSSRWLPEALGRAREALLQLIPADYMGLCLVTPGQPVEFEWIVPGQRIPLLEQYAELADHDFVRPALVRQFDTVVRDSEMLSRRELERSLLYQRSRELNLPLEHVMAAMLTVSPGVFAAVAFYRERRRPFTERNGGVFQNLTAYMASIVRNCRVTATAATGDRLLEELNKRQGGAFLVVRPSGVERMRSPGVTPLLEKWFGKSVRHRSGLPQVLVERLDALTRMKASERLKKDTWVDWRDHEHLVGRFIELPEPDGTSAWALMLYEFSHSIPLPDEMARQLTARQREVAKGILRNWKNRDIADELGCKPGTVKAHVRDIFEVLKCNGRLDFMYQAACFLKPV